MERTCGVWNSDEALSVFKVVVYFVVYFFFGLVFSFVKAIIFFKDKPCNFILGSVSLTTLSSYDHNLFLLTEYEGWTRKC